MLRYGAIGFCPETRGTIWFGARDNVRVYDGPSYHERTLVPCSHLVSIECRRIMTVGGVMLEYDDSLHGDLVVLGLLMVKVNDLTWRWLTVREALSEDFFSGVFRSSQQDLCYLEV
jgi:hypothetical protein